MLRKFYEEAKGQEWTKSNGWLGEFNNHCNWYGVVCNTEGQVISLILGNNSLSGRISDAIGNLIGLEILDLHDNNLKKSIPSTIGNLLNLSSLVLSFNDLTGKIPSEISNLSKLELLHVHANRFTGTVPQLKLKGENYSSIIADCGNPSDFDSTLNCPGCTMCCNAKHECDVTESQIDSGEIKYTYIGFSSVLFALLLVPFLRTIFKLICSLDQNATSTSNTYLEIGEDSVYIFFMSSSSIAWVSALAVLATQIVCFTMLLKEQL